MDWGIVVVLGAYHGVNPGMGWLFAVALGLQQHSARGVARALPPIVLGHALAVGAAVAAAAVARLVIPIEALRMAMACALIGFGLYRLWRHRHPRAGGMQVGFRDLTLWSFLMASGHGAGLMVLPFVMAAPREVSASHAAHLAGSADWTAASMIAVHTLSYLMATAMAAWIVYRWLGLAPLRTAWLNLDWLWAGALVIAGAAVFLAK